MLPSLTTVDPQLPERPMYPNRQRICTRAIARGCDEGDAQGVFRQTTTGKVIANPFILGVPRPLREMDKLRVEELRLDVYRAELQMLLAVPKDEAVIQPLHAMRPKDAREVGSIIDGETAKHVELAVDHLPPLLDAPLFTSMKRHRQYQFTCSVSTRIFSEGVLAVCRLAYRQLCVRFEQIARLVSNWSNPDGEDSHLCSTCECGFHDRFDLLELLSNHRIGPVRGRPDPRRGYARVPACLYRCRALHGFPARNILTPRQGNRLRQISNETKRIHNLAHFPCPHAI